MQVMQWCGSSRSPRRDRLGEALTVENQLFKGWTETRLSGSAVEVLADFGFSPDVEDFDLRFQRCCLAVIGSCFDIGYDGI